MLLSLVLDFNLHILVDLLYQNTFSFDVEAHIAKNKSIYLELLTKPLFLRNSCAHVPNKL